MILKERYINGGGIVMNHPNKSRLGLFILQGLCVSIVIFAPTVGQSATYHVARTGDDSHPGTLGQPFLTFKRAVSVLQPGDKLYIRGGVWDEQLNLQDPNKTGSPGNYITIAGYPGETVTIQWTDSTDNGYGMIKTRGNRGYFIFENLVLDGINMGTRTGWLIHDLNHHFILRNLTIKNQKSNGLKIAGNDIQVINCKISNAIPSSEIFGQGSYYYGIYVTRGANVTIEGSEIYNNSGGGVHVYPGPHSNIIIRNNFIHDNNYKPLSSVGGIIAQGSINAITRNTLIYNNVVANNGSSPMTTSGNGIDIGIYTDGTKVWNNTVYGNKLAGIKVAAASATNTIIQNNIIYRNGEDFFNKGTSTIYDHNLTIDPKFKNPDAYDFRLQATSPAIDKGITLSEVTTDILGILRAASKGTPDDRYEIGAYEESASDSNSPIPPKNVSIQ